MSRAKEKAQRTKCLSNVKQFDLGMINYAIDNKDRLFVVKDGSWAWDLPTAVSDFMLRSGILRDIMYDPGFPAQNIDLHWNFAGTYRVIGYAMTFPNGNIPAQNFPVLVTYQNPTIIPQPQTIGAVVLGTWDPSRRVMVACAVLNGNPGANGNSSNYNTMIGYNWTDVVGGSPVHHRSPHVVTRGKIPTGGNSAFVDGSAKWVKFQGMQARSAGPPYFYW
jgi:hypothetical protein